jgi:hypothetical protein
VEDRSLVILAIEIVAGFGFLKVINTSKSNAQKISPTHHDGNSLILAMVKLIAPIEINSTIAEYTPDYLTPSI